MTDQEMRELDAWIAEKVMGWKWLKFSAGNPFEGAWDTSTIPGIQGTLRYTFTPTTDPAAAWSLQVKLVEMGEKISVSKGLAEMGGGYVADNELPPSEIQDNAHWAHAKTPQLAICLLAKKLYAQRGEGE